MRITRELQVPRKLDAAQVLKIGLIVGGQWQRVRPRVSRMGYRAFGYFKKEMTPKGHASIFNEKT